MEIKVEDGPKYRAFRWVIEVPGIPAWIVAGLTMETGVRWKLDFHYVNDMRIGTCPVATEKEHDGTLKILDETGAVIQKATFQFRIADYIPAVNLDYTSGDFVRGRVVLDMTSWPSWS